MMEMDFFQTSESFTSVDGKIVKYVDVYSGVVGRVRSYVRTGFLPEDMADDLIMSVITKFHESCVYVYDSQKSSPRTYGAMMAFFAFKKLWEKNNHLRMVPLSSLRVYEEDDESIDPYALEDSILGTDDAEMRYDQKELIDKLQETKALGSDVNRRIVELTGLGFKPAEIAEQMDLTSQAVYNRLNRIRKELKPLYDSYMAA